MNTATISSFLSLVRLGIGHQAEKNISVKDWAKVREFAEQQGLYAVVLDGIEKLPSNLRPTQGSLLEWIGEVLQSYDYTYEQYCKAIAGLSG